MLVLSSVNQPIYKIFVQPVVNPLFFFAGNGLKREDYVPRLALAVIFFPTLLLVKIRGINKDIVQVKDPHYVL